MQRNKFLFVLVISLLSAGSPSAIEWTEGTRLPERQAVVRTIAQIMEQTAQNSHVTNADKNINSHIASRKRKKKKKILDVNSAKLVSIPAANTQRLAILEGKSIFHSIAQTTPTTPPFLDFTAATFEDSGVVPPDAMGVIGPAQFILAANGRIRSFNKTTGQPDHVLDISTDLFFSPVAEGFTTDSQIRYDRFSERWFITISAAAMKPVRFLLAMSEDRVITPETKWSFFYLEPRPADWSDYPSLGIDRHALYIGYNFLRGRNYVTSDAIVIPKIPLLAGIMRPSVFYTIVDPNPAKFEGPISPQGVDNFDEDTTEGYVIGIDGLPGRLMLRRIKDPGGHPMISENIPIKVPNSHFPLEVPQKGSIGLDRFFLQGFDKRLGDTHIRDKFLYTAHNIGVDNAGNLETSTPSRDGCLWYEIDMTTPERPTVVQSGILFQPTGDNDPEERYYWMPGIMTNGLHSLVIACSTSGDKVFADAAYALRYSNDPPGTLRKPHRYTKSDTLYTLGFPPFKNLRWGEYSTSSVDPEDDMTLWCIAEFTKTPLSWGLQALRIPARPPAKIVSVFPAAIKANQKEVAMTIRGERIDGSAFYDPGKSFSNRLKVEIEGIKITALTWVSSTQIDLIASTEESTLTGPKKIKITNPDGQTTIAKGLFSVVSDK